MTDLSVTQIKSKTEKSLTRFCKEVAKENRECFESGTRPENRQYRDLWQVWDANGDGVMQTEEMETVLDAMDLDGDTHPTDVEILAYLTRNQYLVCRPLRDLVLT